MKSFIGKALRWEWCEGVIELTLDRAPANEIGTVMLGELEQFVAAAKNLAAETSACIISSTQKSGFSAGPDLRGLFKAPDSLKEKDHNPGLPPLLHSPHAVPNYLHQ